MGTHQKEKSKAVSSLLASDMILNTGKSKDATKKKKKITLELIKEFSKLQDKRQHTKLSSVSIYEQ